MNNSISLVHCASLAEPCKSNCQSVNLSPSSLQLDGNLRQDSVGWFQFDCPLKLMSVSVCWLLVCSLSERGCCLTMAASSWASHDTCSRYVCVCVCVCVWGGGVYLSGMCISTWRSHAVTDTPSSPLRLLTQALTSTFLMHQMLTIIRHAVSHPAIIKDDSVPCGRCACHRIRAPAWISSAAALLRPSIDPINDSSGKVSHKQPWNDNNNKQAHYH